METLIEIYMLAKANAWSMVGLYVALGLISLLIANRSQIDEWAEKNPRVAGILKLMRALGIDPWMLLQSISLIVRGRLPKPPSSNGGSGGSGKGDHIVFPPLQSEPPPSNDRGPHALASAFRLRLVPLAALLCLLALPGCSAVRDVVWRPIAKCSPAPEQVFADVLAVLGSDPGASLADKGLAALEELARKYSSTEFVQCAVAEVLDTFAGSEDAEELRLKAKAADFFERTGTRAE